MSFNQHPRVPLSLRERLEQAALERLKREGPPLPEVAERNEGAFLPERTGGGFLPDREEDAVSRTGAADPERQRQQRLAGLERDERGRWRVRPQGRTK
jgi:hypothetical protein